MITSGNGIKKQAAFPPSQEAANFLQRQGHVTVKQQHKYKAITAVFTLLSVCATSQGLTRIRDIAHPWGERVNQLHCLGLVVGLNGTGDGGDSLITTRPLREMLLKLGNPATVEELKSSKNVALVQVTAEIGRNGAREGERIDVRVASLGNAKDLSGGQLLMSFLRSANPDDDRIYAVASGEVTIPDGANKVMGVVKNGGVLEANFFHDYVEYGENGEASFTLVIDDSHADWQTAKNIAMTIDQELSAPGIEYQQEESLDSRPMAMARDAKNVLVRIPRSRVNKSQAFIADIMNIQLDLPEPVAVVVVNRKAGTIAITGNVEIAPVSICVDGLMIRITEPAADAEQGLPNAPRVRQSEWAKFDTEKTATTKLDMLIEALDQLKVPVQQKINAIYAIEQAGALRGSVRTE